MHIRKSIAIAAAGVALAGAVSTLPAAAAARPATGGTAADLTPTASHVSTYLTFKKNHKNPSNSRLSLVVLNTSNPDHPTSYTAGSWRAGSGNGSENTCKRNQGWLPNGTYRIRAFYRHHDGGPHGVNGIAWLLSDRRCWNGTPRTDLFIHSEMLPSGRQGHSEPYRWDGVSDYRSNGCIKLKPSDIRQLAADRASYPAPTELYVS